SVRRPQSLRTTFFVCPCHHAPRHLHSFPTRRSSDLATPVTVLHDQRLGDDFGHLRQAGAVRLGAASCAIHLATDVVGVLPFLLRSEEHTSELQSLAYLVCRLLLEKKNVLTPHSHASA